MSTINFKKVGHRVKVAVTGKASKYFPAADTLIDLDNVNGRPGISVIPRGFPEKNMFVEISAITDVSVNGVAATSETDFDTKISAVFLNADGNLGYTAEDAGNKSTSVATDAASDTKYPSVKAVVTYAGKKLSTASNFANDAAAATGGIAVGDFYHTAGAVKIRLT